MAYKDITPGKKTAKMLAARVIQSERGTTGVEVAFKFKDEERIEQMNWVGWLTPAASENTMKTLVEVLGFNGDDEVVPGTSRFKNESFDLNREVELVIEMETYEGKTSPRIKWVNTPGGGGFKGLEAGEIKSQLNAVGFKALFHSIKGGAPPSAPKEQPHPGPLNEDEVPF